MSRRVASVIATFVALLLVATACGGTSLSEAAEDNDAPLAPHLSLTRTDDVGSTELFDLATNQAASLSDISTGDRPLLLWFWSPSCATCRRHALEIEAFADEHADIVQVVGVGAWESVEGARDFIADTGLTTLPMLYETTGHIWRLSEVFTNSSMQLVSHDFAIQSGTFWFDDAGRQTVFEAAPTAPYAPEV